MKIIIVEEISWIRMLCDGFRCSHMENKALQNTIRRGAYQTKPLNSMTEWEVDPITIAYATEVPL